MRVFLIAALRRARERLEALLDSWGVEVVGGARDPEGAAEGLGNLAFEVILISTANDTGDELLDALEEHELIRGQSGSSAPPEFVEELTPGRIQPFPFVVVLIDRPSAAWANRALQAGVCAVLPEDLAGDALVSALEAVAKGLVVLHPRALNATSPVRAAAISETGELVEPLTSRERQVLQMLAGGLGNKQIATELKISEHTAKFHVASILGKLGASTRTEAVAIGMRRGLILL